MKRILLPALVLVVLAVLGTLVWFGSKGGHSGAAGPNGTSGVDSAKSAALAPGDGKSEALSALEGAGSRVDRALAVEGNDTARAGGPVLSGEVRPPLDCATDDFVEVFALAREGDIDALMNATQPKRAGEDATFDAEAARLVVAHTKLGADGRFELALPAGTKKAHVIFAGRSWFLRDTLTIDVARGDAQVALQAECGGWISGRVQLPASAASRAAELDGELAVMRPSLASMGPGAFGRGGGGFGGGGFRRSERRAIVNGLAFEIWAIDPGSAFTLEFVPAHLAAAQIEIADTLRGRATPVSIALTPGGNVSGRVLGAAGEPIAGASLEARVVGQLFGFDDRTVRKTTTAADGTFQLAAIAAGSVQVTAKAKDRVGSDAKKLDVVEGAAQSGVDFVLSEGEMIAGVVTWKDGKPAAGADVTASSDRGPGGGGGGRNNGMQQMRMFTQRGEDPKTTTDATGHFVIKGLDVGNYTVTAEALTPEDALSSARSSAEVKRKLAWRARSAAVKNGTSDVALVLAPPLAVRGSVTVQGEATPVKSFKLSAQASGGGGRGGQGPGNFGGFGGGARTSQDVDDEHGEFVFTGLREGKYKLTVAADGFATSEAIDIEVPVKDGAPALAIALVRAAGITGVVRSPRGTPVAGATVTSPAAPGGMFGPRGGGSQADELPRVRTDANGHFTMTDLKAGHFALVADSKDWAKSDEKPVDLVAGQVVANLELVMHEGGRITGEFYDEGRAAAGRSITATDMRTFTNVMARTDAAGRFAFEHLAAGNWRVTAIPSMNEIGQPDATAGDGGMGAMFSKMKSTSADVVEGQEVHVILGAAPGEPVAVSGKVTQGGEPVAGVRVTYVGQGQTFGPGMKTAQTGTDGSYAIQLDRGGDYSVSVQPSGNRMSMIEFVETVKQAASVVIDLPLPTARVSGHVKTPEGDSAKGVRVSLLPGQMGVGGGMMGGGFSEITTDDDGNFDINSLRAGNYTLYVGGQGMGGFRGPGGGGGGGGEALYGRKIVSDIKLAESEWRKDVDVRLEKAAGVDVEVLDERGEKVNGASIFARDESGRAVDRMSFVRSDATGHGKYSGLAPGRYTFSARKDQTSSGESAKVEVREGATGTVRVTLSQGTTLTVTTVDANEQAVRARVSVIDEGGRDVAGLMSAQDMMERFSRGGPGSNEQKIGPLVPGKYRVRATTTDGKSMESSVTLTGQAERKMTLTFAN